MNANGSVMLERNDQPMQVVSLQEVVDRYDLLSAEESHLVVTDRDAGRDPSMTFSAPLELGSSNTSYGSVLRQDYNAKLRGYLGLKVYDQMRRGDGQIAMTLRALKTPVLAGRWYMQPYVSKNGKITAKNQLISDFIWENLTKRMTLSWPSFLTELLGFVDFGFYAFEKVLDQGPDGLLYWRKFGTRHPLDLQYWEYDNHGGPNGGYFYSDAVDSQAVWIPIEKLLVFVLDREGGTLDGRSALRPMYKHWYYKENLYKVDAIQKERHGIGIPVIKLPPNYSDKDKAAADQLGRNLRTNEKAHVTLPPFWELAFAELQGQPVDCVKSIQHHDTQISRSAGAFFMTDIPGATVPDPDELFLKGARFVAEVVRDAFNKWAIPELVRLNWGTEQFPELMIRRIGDNTDYRQLSFAVRNFVGANILKPDDKLEAWVRDEMDLPIADPTTVREVATPQQPGNVGGPQSSNTGGRSSQGTADNMNIRTGNKAGQPKQSTAGNMNIGPGSSGRRGRDGQGAG